MSRRRRTAVVVAAVPFGLFAACSAPPPAAVTFTERPAGVDVMAAGSPFTSLRATARRPVLWPLCGPGSVELTRAFPFRPEADADHPHHESCWFAHGDVNGVDFWQGDGRIVLEQQTVDRDGARLLGACSWRDGKGLEVCRDHRILTFAAGDDWRTIDVDVTLLASAGPLRFGDTKEGTFALRLCREFRLTGPGATGNAVNSEGVTGAAVWGKQADWVAYAAVVEGQPFVVAVFDHPDNLRHPTTWHARDYGLLAANPFGLHDFAGVPAGSGRFELPANGTLRFRYRVLLARGTLDEVDVAGAYDAWR